MNFIRSVFLLALFLNATGELFGYDYFSSSLKDVTITQTQMLQTNSSENPEDVLQRYYRGDFTPLEGTSYGKGFSHDTFWIVLKLDSSYLHKLYLSSQIQTIQQLKVFTIKNNQISTYTEANFSPLYLELGIAQKDTFYLIKFETKGPTLISFDINNGNNLDSYMNHQLYISIFLSGIAIALIVYNLFLFIATYNKLYLYYVLMSTSFLFFNLFTRLGVIYLPEIFNLYGYYIVVVSLYMSMFFLYMFTTLFFNFQKNYPHYHKLLKNLILIISVVYIIVLFFEQLHNITMVLLVIYLIVVNGIALKLYLQSNKTAKYFLIATGIQVLTTIAMPIIILGTVEFTPISYNLSFIGLTWDLLFLAFAIGLKIKDAQKSEELNKLLLIQSRQATFGTMIDTISHQWKQPLNELGLQMMNLETQLKLYNQMPTKQMLESTIDKSNNILEFMSTTIDIFRNFFKSSEKINDVDISETINNTLLFLESTFEANNIKVNKEIQQHIKIKAIEEEFAHSILNIFVNSKDIFKQRGIKNPTLFINLHTKNNNAILTIQDNAGGIKVKPINKIFDNTISTKKNGGIGMFITYKIITEKINGSINVKNVEDGVKFTIMIPTSDQYRTTNNL